MMDQKVIEYLRSTVVLDKILRAVVSEIQDHIAAGLEDYELKIELTQDPECDQPDLRVIVSLDDENMFVIWEELSGVSFDTIQRVAKSLHLNYEKIEEILNIVTISVQPKGLNNE